jgi:hypothetical protein
VVKVTTSNRPADHASNIFEDPSSGDRGVLGVKDASNVATVKAGDRNVANYRDDILAETTADLKGGTFASDVLGKISID